MITKDLCSVQFEDYLQAKAFISTTGPKIILSLHNSHHSQLNVSQLTCPENIKNFKNEILDTVRIFNEPESSYRTTKTLPIPTQGTPNPSFDHNHHSIPLTQLTSLTPCCVRCFSVITTVIEALK